MSLSLSDFRFENELWRRGYEIVAGVDEVGRGCLAGPVVAVCVVFKPNTQIKIKINDSKKLTSGQRELSATWIKANALAWGVGEASVGIINRIGIVKATQMAFRKAVANAGKKAQIDFLLLDAFYAPYVKGLRRKNQNAIVKGDTKVISIAAASIIAKVYRDELMAKLARKPRFRHYKWDENKGYGTLVHRNAIKKYGITRLHRKSFIKI